LGWCFFFLFKSDGYDLLLGCSVFVLKQMAVLSPGPALILYFLSLVARTTHPSAPERRGGSAAFRGFYIRPCLVKKIVNVEFSKKSY
jgi:hypothetical protein